MDEDLIEPDVLHHFLVDYREPFDNGRRPLASQWVKAVCLYDWLTYGCNR